MDSLRVTRLAFIVAGLVSTAIANCYHPTGQSIDGTTYQPCNQINGQRPSMCCALNRDIKPAENDADEPTQDKCLDNGLCQNVWKDWNKDSPTYGELQYWYWREGCSNANWEDCLTPYCQNIGDKNSDKSLTPCGDTYNTTKWCCNKVPGQNASDCCSQWPHHTDAVTIPLNYYAATSTSSSSSTSKSKPSPAADATTQESSKTSGSSGSSGSSGLSTAAKVGIGVGVALAVLAIACVVALVIMNRIRQKRKLEEADKLSRGTQYTAGYHRPGLPPVELEGNHAKISEMYQRGPGAVHEL